MPTKTRYLTDAQLTVVGRRYGSDEIALEASEALARWRRDVAALAGYGYGQSALDAFAADLAQHTTLRVARPEAVGEKKTAVVTRDKQVSRGWAWVDRVSSILGMLARTDQTLATALATARPTDDAGLEAGIRALATILSETKGRLAADAQADQRLAEVDALCTALQSSPGTVHTSKGQTVADTAQIDLCDGKLYMRMRDLNSAGRASIRNGDLRAGLGEYTFHHLKNSGNPNPVPAPAPAHAPSQGQTSSSQSPAA
jgi:hypothetical protein